MLTIISAEQSERGRKGETFPVTSQVLLQNAHVNETKLYQTYHDGTV